VCGLMYTPCHAGRATNVCRGQQECHSQKTTTPAVAGQQWCQNWDLQLMRLAIHYSITCVVFYGEAMHIRCQTGNVAQSWLAVGRSTSRGRIPAACSILLTSSDHLEDTTHCKYGKNLQGMLSSAVRSCCVLSGTVRHNTHHASLQDSAPTTQLHTLPIKNHGATASCSEERQAAACGGLQDMHSQSDSESSGRQLLTLSMRVCMIRLAEELLGPGYWSQSILYASSSVRLQLLRWH
jgi:hypothetical protein